MVKWVLLASLWQYRSASTHKDSPPHPKKREAAAVYTSFDLSPCYVSEDAIKLKGKTKGTAVFQRFSKPHFQRQHMI